jgi:hypothetical protein
MQPPGCLEADPMPLTLTRTHDTTLTIDDEPIRTHIVRFTKGQSLAFERAFRTHGRDRGTTPATEEEQAAARDFVEESIRAYVSIDAGQITDDGHDVTTGDDLIRSFCSRADVLGAFYGSIYTENFLGLAQKKISRARPAFSPGSASSLETGGRTPAPTAGSAGSSTTASPARATASNGSTDADDPDSSGEKVH